jgi:hypothetical protein
LLGVDLRNQEIEFLNEMVGEGTFDEIFGDAIGVSLSSMLGIVRGSEEIDRNAGLGVIPAQPVQDVQPVHAWHVQIEEDDVRSAVGIDRGKIAQGEEPVPAAGYGLGESNLSQAQSAEFRKLIVVLDMQDPDGVSRQEVHEVILNISPLQYMGCSPHVRIRGT